MGARPSRCAIAYTPGSSFLDKEGLHDTHIGTGSGHVRALGLRTSFWAYSTIYNNASYNNMRFGKQRPGSC